VIDKQEKSGKKVRGLLIVGHTSSQPVGDTPFTIHVIIIERFKKSEDLESRTIWCDS
jgi:hypothetical protein